MSFQSYAAAIFLIMAPQNTDFIFKVSCFQVFSSQLALLQIFL